MVVTLRRRPVPRPWMRVLSVPPPSMAGVSHDHLVVRGAREHNLKDISLDLPRDSLVVFTGLSGSGKSSLAFDTIFAEGQRRYVESLSAYARQFLGQMDKPDVDFIEGLSPAVSIDQKSTNRNPRSTVGTITEVYDYLRLLFARAGRPHCPVCGEPITRQSPQQIVDRLLELPEGTRFQVLAPVVRARKGEYVDLFAELQSKGFARARVDGEVVALTEPPKLEKQVKHTIEVVVDRLVAKGADDPSSKRRLTDSVETALGLAGGVLVVEFVDLDAERPRPRAAVLREDGLPQRPPAADGRGRAALVLVQQPVRRLPRVHRHRHRARGRPRPHRPRRGPQPRRGRDRAVGQRLGRRRLLPAGHGGAGRRPQVLDGHPVARRCRSAPRRPLLHGTNHKVHVRYSNRFGRERSYSTGFEGVIAFVKRRHAETDSDWSRERYEGYMREVPCPVCQRRPAQARVARRASIGGRSIAEVSRAVHRRLPRASSTTSTSPSRERQIAERVLKEIHARLGFLLDVGLDYLSPRPAGRHAVRRRGPAHPARHPDRLRPGRRALRARRAVHRPAPARQPPAHRDPDPAARPRQHAHRRRARRGHHRAPPTGSSTSARAPASTAARSCTRGTVADLLTHPDSLTGAYLSGRREIPMPAGAPAAGRRAARSPSSGRREHNLRRDRRVVPARHPRRGHRGLRLGQVDAGQRHPLHRAGQQAQRRPAGARAGTRRSPGSSTSTRSCTSTSAPIGRTPRSNPATYTGVFDHDPQAVRRRPPRRRSAATSRAGSRSTSRAAAARRARATAPSRSR